MGYASIEEMNGRNPLRIWGHILPDTVMVFIVLVTLCCVIFGNRDGQNIGPWEARMILASAGVVTGVYAFFYHRLSR